MVVRDAWALTVRAKSEWYPGQYCYTDSTRYIMYRCDCTRGGTAEPYPTLSDQAQCAGAVYDAQVHFGGCYLGAKTETTYLTSYGGETPPYCDEPSAKLSENSTVQYVCADTTDSAQTPDALCSCYGTWTNRTFEDGGFRESRDEYSCGDVVWSTRCQDTSHNISGVLQSGSAPYNCTRSGKTEYQCACADYYYTVEEGAINANQANWCRCAQCPTLTAVSGTVYVGRVSWAGLDSVTASENMGVYYYGADITDCAQSRGTFADAGGTYSFADWCPYVQ